MFAIVRLVDPGICMQVSAGAGVHHIEHSEHCYSVWNKSHRSENCISQEAIRTSKTQSKVETDGGEVYYVLASRVEIDGFHGSRYNCPAICVVSGTSFSACCVCRILKNEVNLL